MGFWDRRSHPAWMRRRSDASLILAAAGLLISTAALCLAKGIRGCPKLVVVVAFALVLLRVDVGVVLLDILINLLVELVVLLFVAQLRVLASWERNSGHLVNRLDHRSANVWLDGQTPRAHVLQQAVSVVPFLLLAVVTYAQGEDVARPDAPLNLLRLQQLRANSQHLLRIGAGQLLRGDEALDSEDALLQRALQLLLGEAVLAVGEMLRGFAQGCQGLLIVAVLIDLLGCTGVEERGELLEVSGRLVEEHHRLEDVVIAVPVEGLQVVRGENEDVLAPLADLLRIEDDGCSVAGVHETSQRIPVLAGLLVALVGHVEASLPLARLGKKLQELLVLLATSAVALIRRSLALSLVISKRATRAPHWARGPGAPVRRREALRHLLRDANVLLQAQLDGFPPSIPVDVETHGPVILLVLNEEPRTPCEHLWRGSFPESIRDGAKHVKGGVATLLASPEAKVHGLGDVATLLV
eukprot:scaffold1830_cov246-Pinguiococcus_pyrenoidosus.AAC.4